VVFVCRAGARSVQACVLLTQHGNPRCASLRQGLLQWTREGRLTCQ
jgi:rhodanese-related sulfurtransferase